VKNVEKYNKKKSNARIHIRVRQTGVRRFLQKKWTKAWLSPGTPYYFIIEKK
jgi:hypothetical protein